MGSFNYNVTGERRKALVRAMSEFLGEDAIYQGAPTFAYKVDGYTVSRSGLVTCPDSATGEEVEQLVTALRELNFVPERTDDANRLTVEISRAGFSEEAYSNLQKIIASKAPLLRKALGTERLLVEMSADRLMFPWFTLHGLDGETDAYTRLITALCKMAKGQKRVTARARNFTNEKFSMRVFLIRLGFIGNEYKTARKILLRNLTGNSAWKYGPPPEWVERHRRHQDPAASAEENIGGVPYGKQQSIS